MMFFRALNLVLGLSAVVAAWGCGGGSVTDDEGRLVDAVVLGETGTHPGQFMYPRAMDLFEIEGRGYAVVIDKTARMQMIDLETGGSVGETLMPVFDRGMPTGVSVGPSVFDGGRLAAYVADTHEHRVLMYGLPLDGSGAEFEFGTFGEGEGEFVYPTDVVVRVGGDGEVSGLLISEYGGNDRISRYRVVRGVERGVDGAAVSGGIGAGVALVWDGQIGTASETVDGSDGEVALSRPQSIGVWGGEDPGDGADELIVVDSSHHRVGRLTMDGGLIAWYERDHDPRFAPMGFPYGLTVLDDGSALVSEFGGNVVRRMDLESGMTIEVFGVGGRGDGELATPWASGVMDGRLVILDSGNNRVQIVGFDGSERVAGGGG